MSDRVFADSNVTIYALDPGSVKGEIALSILRDRPIISTQVVMETVNVLIRKLRFARADAFEHARFLMHNTSVKGIQVNTLERAFNLSIRYHLGHWDSVIIAAALEAGCKILYSEDLADGQEIQGLIIRNPFKTD